MAPSDGAPPRGMPRRTPAVEAGGVGRRWRQAVEVGGEGGRWRQAVEAGIGDGSWEQAVERARSDVVIAW